MEALGFDVEEDDSDDRSGHGAGNLIATMKGTAEGIDPIYFTCHMDTVVPGQVLNLNCVKTVMFILTVRQFLVRMIKRELLLYLKWHVR